MNRLEKLTGRVAAINLAHSECNRLYPLLREFFLPYVGQKILKADGKLFSKIADNLEGIVLFDYSKHTSIYRLTSNYSLAWTVKTDAFVPPQSCVYHEQTIYVGSLDGSVLTTLTEFQEEFRTDYTVEEILNKREEYQIAKCALDKLGTDLWPFGESCPG